ncbi:MAG TPA: HEAT repeat domain-containing protein [Isosphaeraceae bacterium]|nr:HEAT repeat domain-containing protein [Isosphaeraceae bacterium]
MRRRFGPLFYGTLILSGICLLGRGGWYLWPSVHAIWERRTLARQLRDPVQQVRQDAAERLRGMGSASTWVWLDAMRDPDPSVRIEGSYSLLGSLSENDKPPDDAIQAWLAASRDPDASVRYAAIETLSRIRVHFGPALPADMCESVVKALGERLDDSLPALRSAAASALGGYGSSARSAIPELRSALNHSDPQFRMQAAGALLAVGTGADRQQAVETLVLAAADPNPSLVNDARPAALDILKGSEPKALARIVPALRTQVKTQGTPERVAALTLLGWMGRDAAPALPNLLSLLDDPDPQIRLRAALTIPQIDPEVREPVITTLVQLVEEPKLPHNEHMWNIARLRNQWPGSEARVVPMLLDRLRKADDDRDRIDTIQLLGHVGPEARAAVPILKPLMNDPADPASGTARFALSAIDPDSVPDGQHSK